MKTQPQNPGLKNRSERLATLSTVAAMTPRPAIDFPTRRRNRRLPPHRLLHLLRTTRPELYDFAEVVGRWVWVRFKQTPDVTLRRQLAQFGFHWNRTRQAWQHPCGLFRDASFPGNPRRRYGSYFPADHLPA